MSEKPEKNKSGAGKFFLGAAIGAALGALAGKFIKVNVDVEGAEEFNPEEEVEEKKPKPKKRSTK